jgi:NAD(P) transhydrogenase subunit beta
MIIFILLAGLTLFNNPSNARIGNLMAAAALILGAGTTLWRYGFLYPWLLTATIGLGTISGWYLALKANMLQIPAMIAFQHGAGGLAACLVAYVELISGHASLGGVNQAAGIIGLIIGAGTFSGSLIASGKLAGRIRQTPSFFPKHNLLLILTIIIITAFVFGNVISEKPSASVFLFLTGFFSFILGILFSMRIGGADMPVLISFLNATAGLAAAWCGIALQNRLLITFGATVAASGSILTHVMCKGMNRGLLKVLMESTESTHFEPDIIFNIGETASQTKSKSLSYNKTPLDNLLDAIAAIKESKSVVIIPGYGMAVAQAQFNVAKLSQKLCNMGKTVRFAIHPVAGRMPGHMHVVLAEAGIDYSLLYEMDAINAEFKNTDLAIVVGACDVINPAAMAIEGTPLSGMPILMAQDAAKIIVCNLDEKPGYSGVENLLYQNSKTILLLGDAQKTTSALIEGLSPHITDDVMP